jgi:hypothetical protein
VSWIFRDDSLTNQFTTPVNMMPLFHVGGIVRNLLAVCVSTIWRVSFVYVISLLQPIFSGGSSIMCEGFDPIAFWTLAERMQATWYFYRERTFPKSSAFAGTTPRRLCTTPS